MKPNQLIVDQGIPRQLLLIITVMAALTVANLHYNVPVLDSIRQSLGVTQVQANLITVFTQAGYAAGLLFIVSLGDLLDARRVIGINFVVLVFSLLTFAFGRSIEVLWLASIFTGLSSVAVQMYIPMISKYSRPEEKERNVGYIVSGVIIGVLIGRVVGGIIGEWFGWRNLYVAAAVLMVVCCVVLFWLIPPVKADFKGTYGQLMKSIFGIIRENPRIVGMAVRSALCFASFNTLWACMAFHLASPPFCVGSAVVGYLGLCGILTALAAAGIGKYVAVVGVKRFNITGFLVMLLAWGILLWSGDTYAGLVVGIILVDVGQQFVSLSNQATALAISPKTTNRINTFYMTVFFVGGSMGTFLAGQGWKILGWEGVVLVGSVLVVLPFVSVFGMHKKQ